ncbi:helix-turn-helix transcriptional regulator [Verrucomicrobiaceae bacterium N1E253]|uniref:Helix-turn-helix transcriptional regulator n=1 Tax=Oceaniferula marina TaxID=2748318 RepID=A0A851GKT7_9BACT|nr:AraC family transcriptional regulator [Oceaniferula marina]NWK56451.1 helix-turn-helix transcriptional regulator [Oceaniferula marina]
MSNVLQAEHIDRQVLHMIRTLLRSAPVNWDDCYQWAGIGLRDKGPSEFIPQVKILDIFLRVADLLDDPFFVMRYFDAEAFYFYPNLYGSVMALSENMREFEQHYEKYNQLYKMGGFTLTQGEQRGFFEVGVQVHSQHQGKVHFADFVLLFYNASLIRLSGKPLQVIKHDTMRKQVDKDLYWHHYGTKKLTLGMPSSVLYNDLEIYQRPFRQRDPQVLELIRKSADQQIQQRPSTEDLEQTVKGILVNRIGSKEISAESVASALSMSRATLFRKLKKKGLTFQKIYDDLRRDHALRLLLETRLETWKVAEVLGFSSDNNFRRFFKSYENITPYQYRKKHQPSS